MLPIFLTLSIYLTDICIKEIASEPPGGYLGDSCTTNASCVVKNSDCLPIINLHWQRQNFCVCKQDFEPVTGRCVEIPILANDWFSYMRDDPYFEFQPEMSYEQHGRMRNEEVRQEEKTTMDPLYDKTAATTINKRVFKTRQNIMNTPLSLLFFDHVTLSPITERFNTETRSRPITMGNWDLSAPTLTGFWPASSIKRRNPPKTTDPIQFRNPEIVTNDLKMTIVVDSLDHFKSSTTSSSLVESAVHRMKPKKMASSRSSWYGTGNDKDKATNVNSSPHWYGAKSSSLSKSMTSLYSDDYEKDMPTSPYWFRVANDGKEEEEVELAPTAPSPIPVTFSANFGKPITLPPYNSHYDDDDDLAVTSSPASVERSKVKLTNFYRNFMYAKHKSTSAPVPPELADLPSQLATAAFDASIAPKNGNGPSDLAPFLALPSQRSIDFTPPPVTKHYLSARPMIKYSDGYLPGADLSPSTSFFKHGLDKGTTLDLMKNSIFKSMPSLGPSARADNAPLSDLFPERFTLFPPLESLGATDNYRKTVLTPAVAANNNQIFTKISKLKTVTVSSNEKWTTILPTETINWDTIDFWTPPHQTFAKSSSNGYDDSSSHKDDSSLCKDDSSSHKCDSSSHKDDSSSHDGGSSLLPARQTIIHHTKYDPPTMATTAESTFSIARDGGDDQMDNARLIATTYHPPVVWKIVGKPRKKTSKRPRILFSG